MPHTLDFHMADRASGNNTIKMTQTRINRTLFGTDGDLFTFLTRTFVWMLLTRHPSRRLPNW